MNDERSKALDAALQIASMNPHVAQSADSIVATALTIEQYLRYGANDAPAGRTPIIPPRVVPN